MRALVLWISLQLATIVLLLVVQHAGSAEIAWIADEISYSASSLTTQQQITQFLVTISHSGPFYETSSDGNFAVKLSMWQGGVAMEASTPCLPAFAVSQTVSSALANSEVRYSTSGLPVDSLSRFYAVQALKYENKSTFQHQSIFRIRLQQRSTGASAAVVTNVIVTTEGCVRARTKGFWNDATRWTLQRVPVSTDDIVLPLHTGVILLTSNVTVRSLNMSDGLIVSHQSQCPDRWTASLRGNKCWKLFDSALSFADAEQKCNTVHGSGSADRHLAHIRDRTELEEVQGLCRGGSLSLAKRDGCWIGLRDRLGDGVFEWLSLQAVGGDSALFLDWRRFEPNNHTISHDNETYGGERCTALFPGQEDALLREQGSWVDDACAYPRPYICQVFKTTLRYWLTTSAVTARQAEWEGGVLVVQGTQASTITHLTLSRTATLVVNQSPNTSLSVEQLHLEDGARVEVHSRLRLRDNAFLGERSPSLPSSSSSSTDSAAGSALAQPRIDSLPGSSLRFACTIPPCNATINARVHWRGRMNISAAASLRLLQGGDLSQATIGVARLGSLVLDGYAGQLSTYDAFELVTSNRGPFEREYRGTSADNELSDVSTGVFRVRVTVQSGAAVSTACIPYDASAEAMAAALNALSVIQHRGNIFVRRYGGHTQARFEYGYTYRLELNQPATSVFEEGPVTLDVACYGLSCGCAETLVPLVDQTGAPACPTAGNFSVTHLGLCNVEPVLAMHRISRQSFANTTGEGTVSIQSGTYRLPPIAQASLAVVGTGTGIVSADRVVWHSLQARDVGQLIVTGYGWEGWDSAELLYAPHWTDRRGLVSYLQSAPTCHLSSTFYYLDGLGSVFVAAPNATLQWTRGEWNGGMLGGLATLVVVERLAMNGVGKSLKYGLTMKLAATASGVWTSGNVSLANGARLIVEGNLTVDNAHIASSLAYPMAMGEAGYLQSLTDPAVLLEVEDGRNWQSYFSLDLLPELRPGWYANPLCDPRCFDVNVLEITERGWLILQPNASATFLLPVDLVGHSRMRVGLEATVDLAAGGTCGNNVVVDLSEHTQLTLSGGQMEMEATCTIRGAGELLVVAGSHYLAFSIDAHITIAGGALVWPESRGVQKTITFKGGLLLEGTGVLEVQPFSTTILVHEEVRLTGNCLIQFPLIGIAAQASTFDSSDAPDTSPRGNFTATGVMIWEGGSLKGKADFNVQTALYLDGGTKYIQSLAKLVNQGHCEWGAGDLLTSDNGDFQNFGTVQMRSAAEDFASNAMYKGAALPIENGGDVFALEFHSWDTDLGALNTEEYVRLTSLLVSRVPNGWTPEDQG